MNVYKRQSIQKLVIDQAGGERLILNDLILGRDGAEIVAQLIPQYHNNLRHLEIKGNNIDADGFEMVLMALMNCPNLVTLQAEWNNIGSSPAGLMGVLHLVRNLRFLELIDLKNNKISHQSADIIAEIIKVNNRSLKVLDLRWNELGQIGAQTIYSALPYNSALKQLLLDDNRISNNTLNQIADYLRNPSRGTAPATNPSINPNTGNHFPITDDAYPSMEVQMKASQLRSKIQNQQKEAMIQQEKLQMQIQKALQRLKVRDSQIHEAQMKAEFLGNENVKLINSLHQSQRILGLTKEKFFGIDQNLNVDRSALRNEKYQTNAKIQSMMEKSIQRHQRELEDLIGVMSQKFDRLQAYLRDRVGDKRINREKLIQIREDIINFKVGKESLWDKVALAALPSTKNLWEEQCSTLQELIAKVDAGNKGERKKGQYLQEQLTNNVMRGLKKEEKHEKDIFQIQNKIKDLHKEMTLANIDIEQKACKIALMQAETIQKQASVDLSNRYINYIQSQNNVNLDIARLKVDQDKKSDRLKDQLLQMRITDVQRAVRQQLAQTKMLKNHYDKILAQLQALAKSTIHGALFER